MTYSLVNMPVLGFDLCRLAGGRSIADVLLRTLRLDDALLGELATVPRPHRPRPAPAPALADALREVRDDPASPLVSSQTVRTLERSMLGDFDALVRLVRDDILSWTWQENGPVRFQQPDAVAAVGVVTDVLAAAYGTGGLDDLPPIPHLTAPGPLQDADLDLGPRGDDVRDLLAAVAAMTPLQVSTMRSAAGGAFRSQWAAAVHDASWAVYLTRRLRPAANAQLLAVRAFGDAGFTARDGAYGVWNALSGAVQATVVGDLVTAESASLLLSHCRQALAA